MTLVRAIVFGSVPLEGTRDVCAVPGRILYPKNLSSKAEAWEDLLANPPVYVTQNGVKYYPFSDPHPNPPPGKKYRLNPYRKDHDESSWAWTVQKWSTQRPSMPKPRVKAPAPKNRYELLAADWLSDPA